MIERAVILCGDDGELRAEHFGLTRVVGATTPEAPVATAGMPPARPVPAARPTDDPLMPLSEVEKHHILAALGHCHNNRTHAARLLGISIRTLRNKLNEYRGAGQPGIAGEDAETRRRAGARFRLSALNSPRAADRAPHRPGFLSAPDGERLDQSSVSRAAMTLSRAVCSSP